MRHFLFSFSQFFLIFGLFEAIKDCILKKVKELERKNDVATLNESLGSLKEEIEKL